MNDNIEPGYSGEAAMPTPPSYTYDQAMQKRDDEYARLQCLAHATELHKGAYDHTVVLKSARAFYAFVAGAEANDA